MLPDDLNRLVMYSARDLIRNAANLPPKPGVYLFFFRGGNRLLQATSYFELDKRRPVSTRRGQHLYTGAARDLRARLRQHMEADLTSSTLRLTLLAIELEQQAISRSETRDCLIKGEKTLTAWLCENATVGVEITEKPFQREQQLLERYPSPFNIVMRRQHPYARSLSKLRQRAFPANSPEHARRVRYI